MGLAAVIKQARRLVREYGGHELPPVPMMRVVKPAAPPEKRGRVPTDRVPIRSYINDPPFEPGTYFPVEDPNVVTERVEAALREKLAEKNMEARRRITLRVDEEARFAAIAGSLYLTPEERLERMINSSLRSGDDQEDNVRRIHKAVKHRKAE